MKKMSDKIIMTIIPFLGAGLIRLLAATMRIEWRGFEYVEPFHREGRHYILAFWHGRLLMLPISYKGREICLLISRSKDGELLAGTIGYFGMSAVRGSSSRGALSALREILRLNKSGVDFGLTPDGPKGPRHIVQPGVIEIARRTGLPIVPLTFSASKKKLCIPGMAF